MWLYDDDEGMERGGLYDMGSCHIIEKRVGWSASMVCGIQITVSQGRMHGFEILEGIFKAHSNESAC